MKSSNELIDNLNKEHGKIVDLQKKIMKEVPGDAKGIFENLKGIQINSSNPTPCCGDKIPWNGKLLFKNEDTECWYHEISEKKPQTVNIEDRSVFYLILEGSMKLTGQGESKTVGSMGSVSIDPGQKHVVQCESDCKALIIYERQNR
jgi:hypothetical protein